jgi:hypothetical protein
MSRKLGPDDSAAALVDHADATHDRDTRLKEAVGRGMLAGMSTMKARMIAGFTAGERDYVRRALDRFFSTLPTVAEGIMLKTWRGGPQAGQPKVPPAAQSLLARGLLRLDTSRRMPMLFFTEAGIEALRAMMRDGRLADREKFAHIRQELGIDPGTETYADAGSPHDLLKTTG